MQVKDVIVPPMIMVSIDKPTGITSQAVVGRVRQITGVKKVGHAGTLDPLATGVLVVAIGREATKRINIEVQKDKTYWAEICLNGTSDTDDIEGKITPVVVGKIPSREEITSALNHFLGEIKQRPPNYSSIKIRGMRAYRRARAGEKFDLGVRNVRIDKIKFGKYVWPKLTLKINCGPGVYIRALARDIGMELGVGGYIVNLRRMQVGEWTLDRSIPLLDFPAWWSKQLGVEKTG